MNKDQIMKIVNLMNELSRSEKRQLSFHFSCKLAYQDKAGNLRNMEENEMDFVHNILDGNHGDVDKFLSGRCSIFQSMNFDIVKWENRLDSDIIEQTDLLDKYKIKIDFTKLHAEIMECCRKEES